MALSVYCDNCGKQREVPDTWAGKRVRCSCGATLVVPVPMASADWGDDSEPAPTAGGDSAAEAAPDSPPPLNVPMSDDDDAMDARVIDPRVQAASEKARAVKRIERKPFRYKLDASVWRAAVISIAYGAVSLLVYATMLVVSFDLCSYPIAMFGAAFLIVAGVLTLQEHDWGPPATGVSAVACAFFPVWRLVLSTLTAIASGNFLWAAAYLLCAVGLAAVPLYLGLWAYGIEKQRAEHDRREDEATWD